MAFTFPALGQETGSPQDRPAHNQNKGNSAQKQSADKPPIEAPSAAAPIAPAESSSKNHDNSSQPEGSGQTDQGFWQAYVSWKDTLAQWAMTLASFAAVLVSIWAVWLVRKTLDATRATVIEAKKATKAAEDAVGVTRESAEHQLRAYVGVKSANITMNDEGELSYCISYINYGQTPAFDVFIRTTCTAMPVSPNMILPVDDQAVQKKSVSVFWPGQPYENTGIMFHPNNTQIPGRFTPEYRSDIEAGRSAILLHGEITYRDVFKEPRTTTYCLMYTGPWGDTKPLTACGEGNEAT